MSNKKLIYVVDDDAGARLLISNVVEQTGYKCVAFESGKKLLADLATTDEFPDLILLDAMLKTESGLDVLIELKSNESTSFISVIMITGAQQVEIIKKAFIVGISDILLKPIQIKLLQQRIKENLTIRIDEKNVYHIMGRLHVESPELLNAVGLKEVSKNRRCYPVSYEDTNLAILIPAENRPKSFLNLPIKDIKKKVKIFRNSKVRWNQIWPSLGSNTISNAESDENAFNPNIEPEVLPQQKSELLKKLHKMISESAPLNFMKIAEKLTRVDMDSHIFRVKYDIRGNIIKNILKWADNSTLALQEAEIWKDKFPNLDPNKKGDNQ